MRRRTEQEWKQTVVVFIVDRVSEFVEHGAHPAFVRPDVAQHTNIALMIDIQAESMLGLPLAFVEIRAAKQVFNIKADAGVMRTRQTLDIGILEYIVK